MDQQESGRAGKIAPETLQKLAARHTASDCATILQVPISRVYHAARRHGIKFHREKPVVDVDPERIRELVAEGIGFTRIADQLQSSYAVIERVAKEHGIKNPKAQPGVLSVNVVKKMAEQGLTRVDVARRFNVSRQWVHAFCLKHDIEMRRAVRGSDIVDVELVERLAADGRSADEIAREVGKAKSTVLTFCRDRGIRLRSIYEEGSARFAEMVESAMTAREISEAMGLKVEYVPIKALRMGLTLVRESDRRDAKLRLLAAKKMSVKEIAREIGITPKTVVKRAREKGIQLVA